MKRKNETHAVVNKYDNEGVHRNCSVVKFVRGRIGQNLPASLLSNLYLHFYLLHLPKRPVSIFHAAVSDYLGQVRSANVAHRATY